MEIIIIEIIISITIIIHVTLKSIKRRHLQDRLLEDQQAITEYERFKMEQEIKRLEEKNKKLKKQ